MIKSQKKAVGFQISSARVNRPSVLEDGLRYIYVRIFLEGTTDGQDYVGLDDVDYVIYKLHPSFEDSRLQRSGNRSSNFEIKIWTYGWFKTSATVITKDGQAFEIGGKVEFTPTEDEIESNGKAEFQW
jgi:hypothetical protein